MLGGVALYVIVSVAESPGRSLFVGFYFGVVSTYALYEFRRGSGSAPIHQGAYAEQLVDELLRKSVPKGWEVRSALSFADGDIDHVLVGDRTVVMVETKSTQTNWKLTDIGLSLNGVDTTIRARKSLGRVRRLVTGGPSAGIDGQAWLVVLSPQNSVRDAQLPTVRGDVQIITCGHIADAAAALPPIVDASRVAANVARVDKLIADRRSHEHRAQARVKSETGPNQ